MKRETSQSTQKEWLIINRNGFSLVEIVLASSIFALLVTILIGAYLYGQESTTMAGSRARATMLAEEGLEAVRNIRDSSFSNLSDGTHGLSTSGNQWNISGSQDVTDIFTRQIIISSIDSNRKSVTANVTWQQNPQRNGIVSIATRFTNWIKSAPPPASCNAYAVEQGYGTGTCRQNTQQCTINGETYLPEGDAICITNFPGDTSQDTCCALP